MKKTLTQGFSIVETIVVLAIFSVTMLAVTQSIAYFYRVNGYTIAQAYQVTNARAGVEGMVRDIREMTFADDGTFPLASMQDYEIGFYSDVDRDNSVEYIEYTLASTTLYRNLYNATGSPLSYNLADPDETVMLSEYVQNDIQDIPIFVYYDGEGLPKTPTSTVTDIRYVQVSVIVNIDPVRDPGEFMLRSSASLRNLED